MRSRHGYLLQPSQFNNAINVFDATLFAGTPVHSRVTSLRPASRDKSDDARSGNTNPVRPVRDDLAIVNNRQTIEQAPYLLQPLLNLRPARPSKVSQGLGSDVRSDLSVKPNTWKLPDLSSLHNVGKTRNQLVSRSQNLIFSRRHFYR
jgi:hypothetical protein